jgi:hypothetical protein
MRTSEQINELATALAAAQATYPPIGKDKTAKAGSYSYDYADLATVLEAVRPALAKQGIAVVQSASAEAQMVTVVTRLMHSSGQWIESSLSVEAETTAPQKLGSAISYARRYGLLALAGVAPADEDDDGQAAHHERRPAKAPEKVGETMRRAVQRDPVKRKWEALEWVTRNHGAEHLRDVLAKVIGRTFPVEQEVLLTLHELESLEKHIILAEAERQEARG